MKFKPGDILYRKGSDKNDLYCVIKYTANNWFGLLVVPNFRTKKEPKLDFLPTFLDTYIAVDLNNYEIKDKFLTKIKKTLEDSLGKSDDLDNLTYIEILAELKKYETPTLENIKQS